MLKFTPVKTLVLTLAVLCIATACSSTRTQKSAGEQIDDTVIATKIKTALIADPLTEAHDIDVAMFKGRVQLNGFVESDAQRQKAGQIARGVNGVMAVDNNLKLKGAERTTGEVIDDAAIKVKVKAALAKDERAEAHQIEVISHDGVVLLGGFVNTAAAKAAAGAITKTVEGVLRVDNQIAVR